MLDTVRNQGKEFWLEVERLLKARIGPKYVLQDWPRSVRRMLDLADVANPNLPADAGVIAEAMFSVLKANLRNNPPVFTWQAGHEPPSIKKAQEVRKHTTADTNTNVVFVPDDETKRQFAEMQDKKKQSSVRDGIPGLISSFMPTKNGRLDYGAQTRVQAAAQKYFDDQSVAATLAEAEGKPFDWRQVHAVICSFLSKEYDKAEGGRERERV